MTASQPHERLALARERAGYATATDAARAFGWNENTYRSHENGERGIKPVVAEKYARAFKVSAAYILVDEKYKNNINMTSIFLGGAADGAGNVKIYSYSDTDKYRKSVIYLPVYFPEDPFAVVALEDFFVYGISSGDLILFNNRNIEIKEAIGRLCLVRDTHNKHHLTVVRRGSEGGTINIATGVRGAEKLIDPSFILSAICVFFKEQWATVPIEAWREG